LRSAAQAENLFDYCLRRLGLSEGSIALRIQVANVSRRFPQILAALAENRLSLTVAGRLAPHLSEENVEKLLSDCRGMTRRELEEYLVRLAPKPAFNPSIRKRPAGSGEPERAGAEAQEETEGKETSRAKEEDAAAPRGEEARKEPPALSPGLLQPAQPEVFNFRFSAGKAFKEKLERLAEVLGVENPTKDMARVLEEALELALEKKDPKRKLERRLQREERQAAAAGKSCPDKAAPREEPEGGESEPQSSRYVSPASRERAFERAGYQCEYTAADGRRCTSRTGLEIEHERPFAIYHSHDERYLRVFCRRHNALSAERVYGAEFIRAKIEEKRREKVSRGASPGAAGST
jgi:hypothetical protein